MGQDTERSDIFSGMGEDGGGVIEGNSSDFKRSVLVEEKTLGANDLGIRERKEKQDEAFDVMAETWQTTRSRSPVDCSVVYDRTHLLTTRRRQQQPVGDEVRKKLLSLGVHESWIQPQVTPNNSPYEVVEAAIAWHEVAKARREEPGKFTTEFPKDRENVNELNLNYAYADTALENLRLDKPVGENSRGVVGRIRDMRKCFNGIRGARSLGYQSGNGS